MQAWLKRSLVSLLAGATGLAASAAPATSAPIRSFLPLTRYVVEGAVAEIMAATPDGNTIVFTNSEDQQVGILGISNPRQPRLLATVDVSQFGEPTAVAVTPNGQYALVTVLDTTEEIADQQPGTLAFIDLRQRRLVASVPLAGIGPDNLAMTPDSRKAIIAIEDEEDEEGLPGSRPGSINFVAIDYDNPAQSQVNNVALDLSGLDGVNYPSDPQPEYIAISPTGTTVAVTLQENNAIALLDIASERLLRIFSAGTSRHARADLLEDGEIALRQTFEGRREPDAIAFTRDGNYLVTANEGDTDRDRFGDTIWSGGRGWSIFATDGEVVYDSGSEVEELAVLRGHYPDSRSENRGIEMEGVTIAAFGEQELAIVGSERGSFLTVYDITEPRSPELISFLPTGREPEGILAIPQRNLILTSNEDDGTIDIFAASERDRSPYTVTEPLVYSRQLGLPFSALSGLHLARNSDRQLYAVPDNAMAPSRIFTLQLEGNEAVVTRALTVTKDGEPASYDLEGIALAPEGGFWLVSEGDDREGQESPNLLLRADGSGAVAEEIMLPDSASGITRFGFEGVTTSADGKTVYVAVQRAFAGETAVRIGAYDTTSGEWSFYFYPLDTDNVDGWVGLSEIARDVDGNLVVIERDNQGGSNGARNVRVKRLYRFSLAGLEPGDTVKKQLVVDLFRDYNWYEEKVEGLAVADQGYWVVSDNDGGEMYSRLLFVLRPSGLQPIPGLW